MKQNFILAIETSTEHLGISVITTDGKELATYNQIAYRNLSDDLHPAIDKIMKQAKIDYDQLKFIATTRGPGSFTSVRVGLAAAKGFAFALDVPIVSITSLEALAYCYKQQAAPDSVNTLSVWVEAHGGNIYRQNFNEGGAIDKPISIKASEAGKALKNGDTVIGNGVLKHREDIPTEIICPENNAYINPTSLAMLALKRFNEQTEDINNTTALYVHPLNYDKTYNKDGTKK